MEAQSIRVTRSVSIPASEIRFRVSRSSGPGGQHANTAETRVEALFDVDASASLTDRQKQRVRTKVGAVVRAVAQDERSQARNRELAVERLVAKLRDALHVERRRVATRPTKASVERRLEAKRRRAPVKRHRGGAARRVTALGESTQPLTPDRVEPLAPRTARQAVPLVGVESLDAGRPPRRRRCRRAPSRSPSTRPRVAAAPGRSWEDEPGAALLVSRAPAPAGRSPPRRSCPSSARSRSPRRSSARPASRRSVKWPNDVLVDGRKVAGILLEGHEGAVVCGIGVNV